MVPSSALKCFGEGERREMSAFLKQEYRKINKHEIHDKNFFKRVVILFN